MTVHTHQYDPTDRRLGRHVHHDDASRDYAVEAAPDVSKLASIRHQRWAPVFDQGQVGSCTANAGFGCLGTGDFWKATKGGRRITGNAQLDEIRAVALYSAEERLLFGTPYDPADPTTDRGGSGLGIAKVLHRRGYITGYRHAFSLEATLTALASQPVIIGIPWLAAMFSPAADGRIQPVGSVEGGHEIVLDELDTPNRRAWIQNSWGTSWGVDDGRAWLSWDDLGWLLAEQGDCTVFNHPAGGAAA